MSKITENTPWWYSQEEERWNGPCDSREEAICEGRSNYDGESFMVMQAENGEFDLNPGAYRIIDWLDDANCDLTDPDGDGVFGGISKAARDDLAEMVEATIKAWTQKHKLSTRAYMFTSQSATEAIPEVTRP